MSISIHCCILSSQLLLGTWATKFSKMTLYLLKLFPSILLLLLHSGTAPAQTFTPYCSVNTSDTTFKKNLDGLLKSIATGAPKNDDFFNSTVGTGTDQIYGLGICYADDFFHYNVTCNSCLSSVASGLIRDCPDSKVAANWEATGPCFIRYSNENFFNVANTTAGIIYNTYNYSDPELFSNARNALFDQLIAKTNTSAKMMASGEESVNGTDKLYVLLQCTRDLNHQECYKCLSSLISDLQQPLYEYRYGVRLFGFSCFVHYEIQAVAPSGQSPSPETADSVIWNHFITDQLSIADVKMNDPQMLAHIDWDDFDHNFVILTLIGMI